MAIIENWLPASRENYEFILSIWKWFPLVRTNSNVELTSTSSHPLHLNEC